ncbi:hypothetical protein RHMOL_Rhmol05G0137000 [Rhododendron molle]|uniref:Uncharacterized protein n=1 Tax=Rhododendron molle TaxID=49168 RepID=A0ACC0NP32_RHOML|nr:hypothetical protein RHMOL_Rhmol05G0137000 [Rhododendron molle]
MKEVGICFWVEFCVYGFVIREKKTEIGRAGEKSSGRDRSLAEWCLGFTPFLSGPVGTRSIYTYTLILAFDAPGHSDGP